MQSAKVKHVKSRIWRMYGEDAADQLDYVPEQLVSTLVDRVEQLEADLAQPVDIREFARRLGLSVQGVRYRMKTDENFPRPHKLGKARHSKLLWERNAVKSYARKQREAAR